MCRTAANSYDAKQFSVTMPKLNLFVNTEYDLHKILEQTRELRTKIVGIESPVLDTARRTLVTQETAQTHLQNRGPTRRRL